jgi:hypothetical protein
MRRNGEVLPSVDAATVQMRNNAIASALDQFAGLAALGARLPPVTWKMRYSRYSATRRHL